MPFGHRLALTLTQFTADERAWIERDCPRSLLGPTVYFGCVEGDANAFLAQGNSRSPNYLAPPANAK